jgi:hypothetical protein
MHVGGCVPRWKKPDFVLSRSERKPLSAELERILKNQWNTYDAQKRNVVFMASDAELGGLEVVDLTDPDEQLLRVWRTCVPDDTHIFFRELEAAEWGSISHCSHTARI